MVVVTVVGEGSVDVVDDDGGREVVGGAEVEVVQAARLRTRATIMATPTLRIPSILSGSDEGMISRTTTCELVGPAFAPDQSRPPEAGEQARPLGG